MTSLNEQGLITLLLERAKLTQVQRLDTNVYKPVFTPEGHHTKFYKCDVNLKEWIWRQLNTTKCLEVTHLFSNVKSQIKTTLDLRFPFLRRCRSWFSYRNGIYDAVNKQFYLYEKNEANSMFATVDDLPLYTSTANYFDFVVPLEWFQNGFNYFKDINTPNTESIFESQDYLPEDMHWVQALSGRLQHDVGNLENWERGLYLEGPAATGKSLYVKALMSWYVIHDIAFYEPNPGAFMMVGLDDKIPATYIPIPFVVVSNKRSISFPPCFILQLPHTIENQDAKLIDRVMDEIPSYLIKCSFAYHDKINKHGKGSLWDRTDVLPIRFWKARIIMGL